MPESKKRYVVLINNGSSDQDSKFLEFLKSNSLGWWHWFENSWLISDSKGKLSSETLRDELRNIYPGVHTMVLEIGSQKDTWHGFGPSSKEKDGKNMFKWLHDYWNK